MTTIDPNALLHALHDAVATYKGPAPAVLLEVTRDGLSARAASGVMTAGESAPATTEAKFHIGSQTKMVTAAVVLQMASEGQFALDDKLSDVMDVAALSGIANIEDVTLRHLLTHRSGIPDYVTDFTNDAGFPVLWERLAETPPRQVGAAEAIEHLIGQNAPAEFAPGENSEYSNTGFLLLQLAVEHVTGRPLADAFQTRIFDPLGMDGSSFPGITRPDGIISSYTTLNDGLFDVTHLPIDDAGDGGIVSTTEDMTKFMQALVLDRTLVPDSQLDALGQFFDAAGFSEGEFVGHSGGAIGTSSVTLVHMPTGVVFSIALSHASEVENLSSLFGNIMTNVMTNEAWAEFEAGEGPFDLTLAAAELGVSEVSTGDGKAAVQLDMQGVSFVLDGALADLDTDKLRFADDSILFVAEQVGTHFSVGEKAVEALRADNQLIGLGGDDALSGGRGHDRLGGNRGDDTLKGGRGDDNIKGNGGADLIRGNNGDDVIRAGGGKDRIAGGEGNDKIRGGAGDDYISGNNGADEINGGGGDDVINAGRGDDKLKGDGGADTFQFRTGDGSDTIKGFQQGLDLIKIIAGASGFDDLDITQDGDNVVIEFSNVDITVFNAQVDQFGVDDFIF